MLSHDFEPFVQGAPCAVMTRLVGEWLLDEEALNGLFTRHAVDQYEREITLSNLVNVMLDVTCGSRRSPRAAYFARREEITASLKALYGKLNRTEPGLGEVLVEHSAQRAGKLIAALGGLASEPVPGIRSRILDGNMLAGTDHRLKPLRGSRAAALPGKLLALYDCATGLVVKTVLWEDAHSQERALLPQLTMDKETHLIADRNFCVRWFLCQVADAQAWFTVRHHRGSLPLESMETCGKRCACDRCPTGRVYEQAVGIRDDQQQLRPWRMITLVLDAPTVDGDSEVILISNLPSQIHASTIAMAYRERWTIERHFQRLTDWLHCEATTLGHPRAALFAFAVSLTAGNLLAVVIATLRAVHGDEMADNLSYCQLADEIAGAYRGMMLALPPQRWSFIGTHTPAETAHVLRQIAQHADQRRLRKTTRGPKKPRRTPNCRNIRHRSTYRVLQKLRENPC